VTDGAEDLAVEQDRPPFYREPTFGQRLLARLIDLVVLVPLGVLASAVADGRASALVGIVLTGLYEVGFVARQGRTLGKVMLGTQIVDRSSGALPGLRQAALRWLAVAAGSLLALVITESSLNVLEGVWSLWALVVLLPILRPPLHRGVHDIVAGTVVTVIDG
jgi:uncharacterized RDD family membrane protein YckC